MEWLGVLLLYLISGFIKKRQQNKNREIIESDPNWDSEESFEEKEPSNDIEQLLNDLFEQNPKIPDTNTAVKEDLVSDDENQLLETSEMQSEKLITYNQIDENEIISIDDQIDTFEDNIYHSMLSERGQLRYGNKWVKQVDLKKELFRSRKSIRRSIIIKEILEKPLSMRN